jgi:hypothetical protein
MVENLQAEAAAQARVAVSACAIASRPFDVPSARRDVYSNDRRAIRFAVVGKSFGRNDENRWKRSTLPRRIALSRTISRVRRVYSDLVIST